MLWWQNRLKATYFEKRLIADIERLENQLDEATRKIKFLEDDNKNLARIIHKDNKLIPAMELATQAVLKSNNTEDAIRLAEELRVLSLERNGIINSNCNELSISSGNAHIDLLISYMHQKSKANNINLEFECDSDINKVINNQSDSIPSLSELSTLLADLIENAFIATKAGDGKQIKVTISVENDILSIHVFDSGDYFDKNVLKNIGIKQITTHAKESGSGIGLMNSFELHKKYNATYVINEALSSDSDYTKEVAFIFNNNGEIYFHCNSKRDKRELIELYNNRRDINIII